MQFYLTTVCALLETFYLYISMHVCLHVCVCIVHASSMLHMYVCVCSSILVHPLHRAVSLAYSVFGQASGRLSPVVIIHGVFGHRRNWRTLAEQLATSTRTQVGQTSVSQPLQWNLSIKDTLNCLQSQPLVSNSDPNLNITTIAQK